MSAERAYVDQRIADVDAAAAVADIAAETWGLARPLLLRHGMNAIFRSRDVVIRVAAPSVHASCSIDLATMLAGRGIPVVAPVRTDVVEVEALSATAWEYVASSGEPIDWRSVGEVMRQVHEVSPNDLPDSIPTPSPAAFPWWDFDRLLAETVGAVDPSARAGILEVLRRWSGWDRWSESEAVVCHGDVHPGNVIMAAGGPVLIDWDLLCLAPPGWDHAPLLTWTERWGGESGVYEAFADGVGESLRGDVSAEAFAELRLVAATLMRAKAGMVDPAARPEAIRRLAHWRGDPDATVWRAQ